MISHAPAKSLALSCCFCFIIATLSLIFLPTMPGYAQTFSEPGFSTDTILTLPPYKPVGVTFAPDGRMFVWQENGIVRIYKNGALLATPFVDISSHVNIVGDRGMLGLTLDPNFATNGYVYLFYSYEPNGNPNDVAPKTERVTRIKADPANPDVALANSETVVLGSLATAPCGENTDCIENVSDAHTGGTIRFGPDKKLYISTGDGSSYSFADPNALKALNLNYFNGKIIRINADGTAPSDNPFFDSTNSVRSKIFAYGLRNPYRFAIHPTTGEVLIADVGWNGYEEVNRGRGANFGWPCFEGDNAQADYQAAFPGTCSVISPGSITKPIYVYPHSEGQAIIGGAHYTATQFPALYRGNYFFADYPSRWIKRLVFDASGNVSSVQPFATAAGDIVSLELGPDGALYFVELSTGKIKRIRYASAPTANATANPTVGSSPLTVNFSSAGSSDPNGLALSYLWNFGDGTTSTAANPAHTYVSSTYKIFTATLTVTNSQGGSASATTTVSIGNRPPTATINTPLPNTVARPGDAIVFTGSASDPDEPLGADAMSWQLLLHHDTHVHPFQAITGTTGNSFVVEDHGAGTYYYEIILTVTDSLGAKDTKSVNVNIGTPAPPSGTTYLSDLNWIAATNGWGPIEKDKSNADLPLGDGLPLTLQGVVYQKGLGVHANSDIRYSLNGAYSTFLADVGVDDEVAGRGSVIFQVFVDGVQAFDSGVMYGTSATQSVSVNVTGKNELRLVVLTTPDGDPYDHADWANARLLGGAVANTAPTVSLTAPANNATYLAPAAITLTATANDADGTISKVEFYAGTTLVGSATTAPYNFVWNNVAAGNYALTAKAIDDKGAATTSATVNIAVNNNVAPTVSLTAPANNSVFTAPANITLSASASDADGTIAKVEFLAGTTLLGTVTTAPYNFVWSNVIAGNYSLTAKATDNRGAVTTSGALAITVNGAPVTTLPVPWKNQDIGVTSPAGSASHNNGVFTLIGSGAEIWDYADGFQFAWQSLTGDGQIIARVLTQQNTHQWSEVGVMIRSGLTNNAPYAMVALTPNNGARFQWRYFYGGNSGSRGVVGIKAPYWVRLVRTGNVLTGYYSSTGTTWTLLSVEEIPALPATLYFGLVANSHVNGVLCTTTFDRVTIGR